MRVWDVRFVVVGLTLLGLVGTCGEEERGLGELRAFAPKYAQAVCQRIFLLPGS